MDLRLARRRHPLLPVDGEVDLVRAPVLALPERVELGVVEQAVGALAPGAACTGMGVGARLGPAPRADPLLLLRSLFLLARLLPLVAPLRPLHPAAEQHDRMDLPFD